MVCSPAWETDGSSQILERGGGRWFSVSMLWRFSKGPLATGSGGGVRLGVAVLLATSSCSGRAPHRRIEEAIGGGALYSGRWRRCTREARREAACSRGARQLALRVL
jgi:hypothetical protein